MSVIAIGALVVVVQAVSMWQVRDHRAAVHRLDARLEHLTRAMSLLTDTTECGLRDVAQELERRSVPAAPPARARAATQRRVAGAAKRGRSVQDIAATEQMSEGEVLLRLQLAAQPAGGQVAHAAMR